MNIMKIKENIEDLVSDTKSTISYSNILEFINSNGKYDSDRYSSMQSISKFYRKLEYIKFKETLESY